MISELQWPCQTRRAKLQLRSVKASEEHPLDQPYTPWILKGIKNTYKHIHQSIMRQLEIYKSSKPFKAVELPVRPTDLYPFNLILSTSCS